MTTDEPDDEVHYYWSPETDSGRGFYASGPMPSAGVVVALGSEGVEKAYYYRRVSDFGGYADVDDYSSSWRELVPIRCFSCWTLCTKNPPSQPYEFWFCDVQCQLNHLYEQLIRKSDG